MGKSWRGPALRGAPDSCPRLVEAIVCADRLTYYAEALLEGLEECFSINRLDIPRSLHRCLATSKPQHSTSHCGQDAALLWINDPQALDNLEITVACLGNVH